MDLSLVYNVVEISHGHSEEQITEPFRAERKAATCGDSQHAEELLAEQTGEHHKSCCSEYKHGNENWKRAAGTRGGTLIQVISLKMGGGSLSPNKSNKKGSSWDSHETFNRMFALCKRAGSLHQVGVPRDPFRPTHDHTTHATLF